MNTQQPDWRAYWIWQGGGDPAKPNTYVYFRRVFTVRTKPTAAVCHVSGDSSYRLFLNGEFVGDGPVLREPRWQSYDSYDVRHLLRTGQNVIAAVVYHFGNAIGNPEALTAHWSRGGFLCQIDMSRRSRHMESVITDSSWDVVESPAWDRNSPKMDDMTYAEIFDAVKEPANWLAPEFSARGWLPAEMVGADEGVRQWVRSPSSAKVLPWTELEPRAIPHLVREAFPPKAIVNAGEVLELAEPNSLDIAGARADIAVRMSMEDILPFRYTAIANADALLDAARGPVVMTPMDDNISYDDFEGVHDPTLTLDAGRLINGRVFFELDAAAGTLVDIGYGQTLVKGRVIPYLSRRTPMADQYAAREGRQSFQTFGWRHFRYVQLTFRRMRRPVKVHQFKFISESYPVEVRGRFDCDDDLLNWLWQACVETARVCTRDRLMNDPMREKREMGDSAVILHAFYAAYGDLAIIRQYFTNLKRGQMNYGVLPSAILGQRREFNRVFVDGGVWTVLKVWEYYQMCGNRPVLEELFQPLHTFVRHLEQYTDENGLLRRLPYPVYFDWADLDLGGASLCLNAVFAQSMKCMADMCVVLGQNGLAAEYRAKHRRLAARLPRLFWDDKRGVFIDAVHDGVPSRHVSEHANLLMLLFGLADARQARRAVAFLREPGLDIGQIEPSFFWAAEGLFLAGQGALAVELMKRRYARIRKQGLDTISELWSLRGERYTGRWRARDSRSAAQSQCISPAYLLSRYVLGIAPLKPGFDEVLIAPQLCGLNRAAGTWPSPRGDIEVEWARNDTAFRLECRLPRGLTGKIILPSEIFPLESLKLNGRGIGTGAARRGGIPIRGSIKVEAVAKQTRANGN